MPLNKIEVLDAEFKEHHYTVINLVGDDEQKLDEEQAVMDDHKDRVAEITERLQQLRPESKVAFISSALHGSLAKPDNKIRIHYDCILIVINVITHKMTYR